MTSKIYSYGVKNKPIEYIKINGLNNMDLTYNLIFGKLNLLILKLSMSYLLIDMLALETFSFN